MKQYQDLIDKKEGNFMKKEDAKNKINPIKDRVSEEVIADRTSEVEVVDSAVEKVSKVEQLNAERSKMAKDECEIERRLDAFGECWKEHCKEKELQREQNCKCNLVKLPRSRKSEVDCECFKKGVAEREGS